MYSVCSFSQKTDFPAQGDSDAEDSGQEKEVRQETGLYGCKEVKFWQRRRRNNAVFQSYGCHEAASCGEASSGRNFIWNVNGLKIHHAQFRGRNKRPKKSVRPKNKVKQLHLAIAAELGAGAPEPELLIEVDEELEKARPLKRMSDPKEPSAEEKQIHALTDLPYRRWCARRKGNAADHRGCPAEDRGVLEVTLLGPLHS